MYSLMLPDSDNMTPPKNTGSLLICCVLYPLVRVSSYEQPIYVYAPQHPSDQPITHVRINNWLSGSEKSPFLSGVNLAPHICVHIWFHGLVAYQLSMAQSSEEYIPGSSDWRHTSFPWLNLQRTRQFTQHTQSNMEA